MWGNGRAGDPGGPAVLACLARGVTEATWLVALVVVLPLSLWLDATSVDLAKRFLRPLSPGNPLGTDELGRDILSRLVFGGQVSLTVGLSTAILSVGIGALLGCAAGFYGAWIDSLIMRWADVMLSFPTTFLLLIIAAFVGPSAASITVIISLTSWMAVSRLVRAEVLALRKQEFVAASIALGVGHPRLILRTLLPNVVSPISVSVTLMVARAVLIESSLSYLGFGIQPPNASWGNMLNNAQAYMMFSPWLAFLPGLMITLTVVGFNAFGDGLRDALDPRLDV